MHLKILLEVLPSLAIPRLGPLMLKIEQMNWLILAFLVLVLYDRDEDRTFDQTSTCWKASIRALIA